MLLASYLVVVIDRGAGPVLRETRAMCATFPDQGLLSRHRLAIAVNQNSTKITELNLPDPFAVFPNRLQRRQIAPVEKVPGGGAPSSFAQIVPGIAGTDGNKLEHARVAVAVNHATSAAVANPFCFIPLVHVAHRRLPKMAAVKVQVPIQVKIFVPAQATEFLRFLAQMPLHLGERFRRVHDRITAPLFHLFDLFKNLNEFVGPVTDETRIAEAEIARRQGGERITEGAAFESQPAQEGRQLAIIVNQF